GNKGIGQFAVAGGNHQRVVLNDVRRVCRDGVDVYAPADHADRVVGAQRRFEQDVLDVVDEIERGSREGVVAAVRLIEIKTGWDVVAEEYLAAVQVGDHEVQIVHQLDPRPGVSGRIGPDQRYAQRHKLGVGAQRKV